MAFEPNRVRIRWTVGGASGTVRGPMATSRLRTALEPMPAAAGHPYVRALAIATTNDQPRGR